jgi:hypothetical protein
LHERHFNAASSFQIGLMRGRRIASIRMLARFAAAAHREPTTYSRIPLAARPEGLTMKAGNWIILAVLLGMLSATIWIGYDMWITTSDIPVSENGYIAVGIGAALSLLISCGLIALLFYSSRHE